MFVSIETELIVNSIRIKFNEFKLQLICVHFGKNWIYNSQYFSSSIKWFILLENESNIAKYPIKLHEIPWRTQSLRLWDNLNLILILYNLKKIRYTHLQEMQKNMITVVKPFLILLVFGIFFFIYIYFYKWLFISSLLYYKL